MPSHSSLPTDPQILAFIEETARHYPEASNRASAEEARRSYDVLCSAFAFPRPQDVTATDETITARDPDRTIAVRCYTNDSDEVDDDTSCLLYFHGGGWIVGGLESHDSICAELCANTGMDVVAVDYRLCPEHPYPAALDDAEAVYRIIVERYGVVIAGGDSAGGHISAALCIRLRDTECVQPAGQLLIYPAVGATPEGGSYATNAGAPGLTTADVIHYWDIFSGSADWRTTTDPGLAPIRSTDLSGLPPAIITSAGCDPLRDDAMLYANRLTQAGVPVQWRNDPQLIHGHLRARRMSSVAADHFMWVCIAAGTLAASAEVAILMKD